MNKKESWEERLEEKIIPKLIWLGSKAEMVRGEKELKQFISQEIARAEKELLKELLKEHNLIMLRSLMRAKLDQLNKEE